MKRKGEDISNWTPSDLHKFLEKIMLKKQPKSRNIVLYRFCKTNGFIEEPPNGLHICNDPTCYVCNIYKEELGKSCSKTEEE